MITDKTTKSIIKNSGTYIEIRDIRKELKNYVGVAQIFWFIIMIITFFNSIISNSQIDFCKASLKMFLTFSGIYLLLFFVGRFLSKTTFLKIVSNGRLKLYESVFLTISYMAITKVIKLIWFAAKTQEVKTIYFMIHSLFFIFFIFYFTFKSLLYFMTMISSENPSAEILLKTKKINLYYFIFVLMTLILSIFITLGYKHYFTFFRFDTEFDYIYAIVTNIINVLAISLGGLALVLIKKSLFTNMFATPFVFGTYVMFFTIPWGIANLFYITGDIAMGMKIYFYGEIYQFISLIVLIIVLIILYSLKKHYNGEVEI